MANWYVGSTKYTAVAQWAALTTYAVGNVVRQLAAPANASERCFVATAITTGQSGAAEPTWVVTQGGVTADTGVTWTECTGQAIYNGDGGGTAWAAPFSRLANACALGWAAAGDTIYLSNNHNETSVNPTSIIPLGIATSPIKILSIDDTNVPPVALLAGATISTTSTSAITLGGAISDAYFYGISFKSGSGGATAGINVSTGAFMQNFYCDTCTFQIVTTSSSSNFTANGSRDGNVELRNCKILFSSTAQKIVSIGVPFTMIGGSVAASGAVPTSMVVPGTGASGLATFRGVDLSKITGSLVTTGATNTAIVNFDRCVLNPSTSVTTGAAASIGGTKVNLTNCDSGPTNYNLYIFSGGGTIQDETTVVRTNGASDGATPLSWAITTSTFVQLLQPFVSKDIVQWNDVISIPQTATIQIAASAPLTNADIWMELDYLGSASSPQSTTVSTRVADVFATAAPLTSSAVTWGGSQTNFYSISIPFTQQLKGVVRARIYIAKASTTIYVDPLMTIS